MAGHISDRDFRYWMFADLLQLYNLGTCFIEFSYYQTPFYIFTAEIRPTDICVSTYYTRGRGADLNTYTK